jgi:hypothetical protein
MLTTVVTAAVTTSPATVPVMLSISSILWELIRTFGGG